MVDDGTKRKLLKELERTGNISRSCAKLGIGTTTFYRWKSESKRFASQASTAIRFGRKNLCELVEYSLAQKAIKDADLGAMKYYLTHNDPRYKRVASKVIMEHTNPVELARITAASARNASNDKATEDIRQLIEDVARITANESDPDGINE